MQRKTTTKKISETITNNLLIIEKAECHYKSSDRIDKISADKFKESLDFLCESGVFADFVDWHYERNVSEMDEYIFNSGAMNPFTENIVIVYMSICNGANEEAVERTLLFTEEE